MLLVLDLIARTFLLSQINVMARRESNVLFAVLRTHFWFSGFPIGFRFGFGLSAPSRRSGHHTPRKLVRWTPESVLYTGEGEGAKGGPNWLGGQALHMCALLHLCMAGRALHMCALLR